MNLTKEQAKYFKSIQWFYAGPRASGRSTLIAYVLIDTVLKTGEEIRIIDHDSSSARSNLFLAGMIDDIIDENKFPLEINWVSLKLRMKTHENLYENKKR